MKFDQMIQIVSILFSTIGENINWIIYDIFNNMNSILTLKEMILGA